VQGFNAKWERSILKGREVAGNVRVSEALAAAPDLPLTFVRVNLKAEGWKVGIVVKGSRGARVCVCVRGGWQRDVSGFEGQGGGQGVVGAPCEKGVCCWKALFGV
jgi:hypothetical protein